MKLSISFSLEGGSKLNVTVYSAVRPDSDVTVYTVSDEKSRATPDSGAIVAQSEITIVGVSNVPEATGTVAVMV